MDNEDSDITIGPLKLLGLFFMLVAICGVFFAIGYSLGKTSAREQALNDKTPLSASLNAPVVGDASAPKPSAAGPANSEPAAFEQNQEDKPSAPDLTFFNSVKRNDRNAAPTGKSEPQQTTAKSGSSTSSSPAPTVDVATAKVEPKPAITQTAGGGFVVQIAAVTREEDAAALAGALRRKNYSVFVVNNPAVHDKLYHVQVGPFATLQDAEAMKARLTGEGYNPIVKRS